MVINPKVKPTVLEQHLIALARQLAAKAKTTNQIEYLLEQELTKWKLSRAKYRNSSTHLNRQYSQLRLINHEGLTVFTL